jgi:hypothetical protein
MFLFKALVWRRCRSRVLAAVLALPLAACARPVGPVAEIDPADSAISGPPAVYRSSLADYRGRRPVDPGEWKATNEKITPQPKSESGGAK